MNDTTLGDSTPLPAAERRDRPQPSRPGQPYQERPEWSRPARRGPAAAAGRVLGRILGIDPDAHACRCIRCTLHRAGVYRREHVRYGSGAWVRTTVFGIRIRPDRYAFPLN